MNKEEFRKLYPDVEDNQENVPPGYKRIVVKDVLDKQEEEK